ncbi:hypothetical protein [Luedemannella helvata]|uniref:hypothetical protein n=1 Tax=Luedemannella helvata TaxID=349315 RepID=UPI0031D8DB4D
MIITTVLRRVALACAIAAAVWVVHGPILSTAPAHGHGAQPHGWSIASTLDTDDLAADCAGGERQSGEHGHTRVHVPLDLTDGIPETSGDVSVAIAGRARTVGASGVAAPAVEPPPRPPIHVLICVSRT